MPYQVFFKDLFELNFIHKNFESNSLKFRKKKIKLATIAIFSFFAFLTIQSPQITCSSGFSFESWLSSSSRLARRTNRASNKSDWTKLSFLPLNSRRTFFEFSSKMEKTRIVRKNSFLEDLEGLYSCEH